MDKIVKNLGGDRIGSGSKMEVQMHNYERSTHDLSRAWRSTVAAGTLVPFFQEIALNGDTWDIDLGAMVRTLPTVGPLFGSFKLQLDVFQCPLRLYNGILHNNAVKIGMEMDKVIFPKIRLSGSYIKNTAPNDQRNTLELASSCLMRYLGVAGIGMPKPTAQYGSDEEGEQRTICIREFFADGLLAYWDIFKNYYANKQEDNAFVIGQTYTQKKAYKMEVVRETQVTPSQDAAGRRITGSSITRPVVVNTERQITDTVLQTYDEGQWPVMRSQTDGDEPIVLEKGQSVVVYHDPISNTASIGLGIRQNGPNVLFYSIDKFNTTKSWNATPRYARGSENKEFTSFQVTYLGDNDEYAYGGKVMGPQVLDTIQNQETNIELIPFPLENIDEMRQQLLATCGKNTQIILGNINSSGNVVSTNAYKTSKQLGIMPYSQVSKGLADSKGFILKSANQSKLNGLAVKTYQSDIYNNWLNSEWIDGATGSMQSIQQITAVSTTGNSFTIDELILAKKVYDMLNRIAVAGGSYEDWQEAVYGEEAMKRAESPIYCGGMSQEIKFEEIVSSSETSINNENKALGSLAGKGTLDPNSRKGGQITIKVKEPSIILGIVSITPRIDYTQGNEWFTSLHSMNDLHKPALDGIGFQDLIAEQMAWWTTVIQTNQAGTGNAQITQQAIGKQPAWINYQTAVNKVFGEFATSEKRYMTLQRDYEPSGNGIGIKDATTYIDPSKHNYAFANQSLTSQNFWVQIGIKAIARRKMSAKLMPNL